MAEKKNDLNSIKIVVLGDSSVGKSSILNTFFGIEFKEDLIATIGHGKLEGSISLKNGMKIKLVFLDTAGQERFRSADLKPVNWTYGIVLVFDITNKYSFDNINEWIEEIKEREPNPRIVLFGNKIDLEYQRKVTNEEAKEYAKKMNLAYFETSAKTNQGINEGLSYIANEIYDKYEGNQKDNIKINKDDNIHKNNNGKGCAGGKNKSKK